MVYWAHPFGDCELNKVLGLAALFALVLQQVEEVVAKSVFAFFGHWVVGAKSWSAQPHLKILNDGGFRSF